MELNFQLYTPISLLPGKESAVLQTGGEEEGIPTDPLTASKSV